MCVCVFFPGFVAFFVFLMLELHFLFPFFPSPALEQPASPVSFGFPHVSSFLRGTRSGLRASLSYSSSCVLCVCVHARRAVMYIIFLLKQWQMSFFVCDLLATTLRPPLCDFVILILTFFRLVVSPAAAVAIVVLCVFLFLSFPFSPFPLAEEGRITHVRFLSSSRFHF